MLYPCCSSHLQALYNKRTSSASPSDSITEPTPKMATATAKRNPPFRAEHVGSLLRPKELLEHRYAVFADKTATPESLIPVEQAAIKDIVQLQKECGFHAVTNGEFSRHQFWGTFFETLNGMEEVNLREGGYDQSIFRMYAPGMSPCMTRSGSPADIGLQTSSHSCTRKRFPTKSPSPSVKYPTPVKAPSSPNSST